MKFLVAFFTFYSTCHAFDPIDHYPYYLPDFNLPIEEFCDDAIQKSAELIQQAETKEEHDYWCGYRDAFKIMYYRIQE